MRLGPVVALVIALAGCRGCARAATSCHGTEDCTGRGACGGQLLSGPGCVVESSADCAASKGCAAEGLCSFEPTFSTSCVALRTAECKRSTKCRSEGKCSPSRTGLCETTDIGCMQTDGCASQGTCSSERISHRDKLLGGTICVKKSVEQAQWCTRACDDIGACLRDGTRCVAVDAAKCRESGGCHVYGTCSLDAESQSCVAASDEDCAGSKECRDYGECKRVRGGDFCVK